jgi:hypothetical protein
MKRTKCKHAAQSSPLWSPTGERRKKILMKETLLRADCHDELMAALFQSESEVHFVV